jgi:hypothetical protein
MGAVIDTITFQATAPGVAAFAASIPASGDSFTVRNTALTDPIFMLQHWAWNQTAGSLRVRSPKLHDNVQGIRREVPAAAVDITESFAVPQRLWPQDTLIFEQMGSGTAGQIETGSALLYYGNFPGISATLIDLPTLQKNVVNLFSPIVTPTPGVGGGYTGAVAINATEDLYIANTWYALLGYMTSARCATVSVRGPDTGNLRCSGPGEPLKQDVTARWFVLLTAWYGLPLIPCFNSANKQSTFLDVVTNQTGGALNVNLMLAQLSGVM